MPFISSSQASYRTLGATESTPIFRNIGRPTLVLFWASWCLPCVAEVPAINHLQATYGPAGLNILAFNMDDMSEEGVKLLVKKFEIIYPVAMPSPELVRDFRVQAIPVAYLYGPDGALMHAWLGPASVEEIERHLNKVMPKRIAKDGEKPIAKDPARP
jgi:thiol-disulfide isomerase/thioredoxin